MPKRPSSCAVWRVNPIWPAFALAYAWIPVRLTLRPAPDEMFTMRPYPRAFIPGTTARVQRKVDLRFASTTACQSSSATSSSGRPTWPTTPPALFTRMSTRPTEATNASTAARSVTSTVSLSQPWTAAAHSASERAIPAPIPCATPVTIATRPFRSRIAPAVLDQVSNLVDACLPDAQDVLIGPQVEPAEGAVTEQLANLERVELAHPRDISHRLALVRPLDPREARPREVLEPRGVRGLGIDLLDCRADASAGPPVVPHHTCVLARAGPFAGGGAAGVVPAVAVHEQETAEALRVQRVEQVADERTVGLDAQRRAAGVRGEVRREPVRERRQNEDARRLGRLLRHALRQNPVDPERQVRVLLDRAHRDYDPVVAPQVVLDVHPVAVLDPHGATSS